MGSEAVCAVRVDGEGAEAKALLETAEVIVRGPVRARVPFTAVKTVTVDGDTLVLRTARQTVEIDLGARVAARWAEKIRNPKSRIDKLGVQAGQRVAVLGSIADDTFAAELAAREVVLLGRAARDCDLIFFGATRTRDLDRLASLRTALRPNGALWVLRPKGVDTITEMQVIEGGKAAGLVDVKVVKFSETLTAAKLVIPVDQR